MQFPTAIAQFEDIHLGAAIGLAAAQAGDPGAHVQFAQCALHRLDFAQVVIFLQTFEAVFPQFAVTRFHPGDADLRPVDLEIQR